MNQEELRRKLGIFNWSKFDHYISKTLVQANKLTYKLYGGTNQHKSIYRSTIQDSCFDYNSHNRYGYGQKEVINPINKGIDEDDIVGPMIEEILTAEVSVIHSGEKARILIKENDRREEFEGKLDKAGMSKVVKKINNIIYGKNIVPGKEYKLHVIITNLEEKTSPSRKKLEAELKADPKVRMGEMFNTGTTDSTNHYGYRGRVNPYHDKSLKHMVFSLDRKEDRVRIVNLLWKKDIPVSRTATEIDNIMESLEQNFFKITDVEVARILFRTINGSGSRFNSEIDYKGMQDVLLSTGYYSQEEMDKYNAKYGVLVKKEEK